LTVFFRDRVLSDLIGFTYQHWDAREAVADLVRRIEDRRPYAGDEAVIVLALDGENPWSTYPENGVPFLRELFEQLVRAPGIEPVFFEDYLASHPADREIALVPGTWLGNFSKWSGSPEKNNGWARLARARAACGPLEEILIAEGSDWFWWFGEDDTREFAFLFDAYLEAAYRKAGIAHD
jgi:alpha-amylase/alpha-mannosidase (GH57 family)